MKLISVVKSTILIIDLSTELYHLRETGCKICSRNHGALPRVQNFLSERSVRA